MSLNISKAGCTSTGKKQMNKSSHYELISMGKFNPMMGCEKENLDISVN
jgi:hypothetical protein